MMIKYNCLLHLIVEQTINTYLQQKHYKKSCFLCKESKIFIFRINIF